MAKKQRVKRWHEGRRVGAAHPRVYTPPAFQRPPTPPLPTADPLIVDAEDVPAFLAYLRRAQQRRSS